MKNKKLIKFVKKSIPMVMFGSVVVSSLPMCAFAAAGNDENGIVGEEREVIVNNIKYELNHRDKTAKIVGVVDRSLATGKLPIDVVNVSGINYTITVIGACAFEDCYNLDQLVFPENKKVVEAETNIELDGYEISHLKWRMYSAETNIGIYCTPELRIVDR